MTPTDAELKAALEDVCSVLEYAIEDAHPTRHSAAVLRAHLATFDEERAFLAAAETYCDYRFRGTAWDDLRDDYRALKEKREGM